VGVVFSEKAKGSIFMTLLGIVTIPALPPGQQLQ